MYSPNVVAKPQGKPAIDFHRLLPEMKDNKKTITAMITALPAVDAYNNYPHPN